MPNFKKTLWSLPVLMLGLMYPSCKSEYLDDTPVCFERDVLPIFIANCSSEGGCHNSIDRTKGYVFTSYETVVSRGISAGNYRKSEIYKSLVRPFEQMPPSPHSRLSDEQITAIALWIEQGAKETVCAALACDTTNVTYTNSVKPIINTYCSNGCHTSGSPDGGYNLSGHAGLASAANDGSLVGSITHDGNYSDMPKGGNKISACNIAIIQKWVEAGAPNN